MIEDLQSIEDLFLKPRWSGVTTPDIELGEAIELQEAKRLKSWCKISHRMGIALAKRLRMPAFAVLLAVDYAIYKSERNPTKLTNELLAEFEIPRESKRRGLRQLEAAGVVSVDRKGREAPMVTSHWHPKR
jgi:hypothetical protein